MEGLQMCIKLISNQEVLSGQWLISSCLTDCMTIIRNNRFNFLVLWRIGFNWPWFIFFLSVNKYMDLIPFEIYWFKFSSQLGIITYLAHSTPYLFSWYWSLSSINHITLLLPVHLTDYSECLWQIFCYHTPWVVATPLSLICNYKKRTNP